MASKSAPYVDKVVFPLNMGEEAAFEYVFRLYYAPLRYFCEKLTGADEECEDIVSQLFLILWNKKVQFESIEHSQAYLYRSAKNACLNFIRDGKQDARLEEQAGVNVTELSENYLDAVIRTEVWAELYRAIASLPTQCCKVITMSYIEGMSNQEVADELELSLQTVKNYKLRGIDILKNKLPNSMFVLLTTILFK